MKKYNSFLILLFFMVSSVWGQTSTVTLDFRITNPRIIYDWNNTMNGQAGGNCDNFDFDIEVLGSAVSYCHALEIHMTNNITALTDLDFTLASGWTTYYSIITFNLTNDNINLSVANSQSITSGATTRWTQIGTTWKTVGTLRLRIIDISQLENCSWLISQMAGQQKEKYFTPSANVRSYLGFNCTGIPIPNLYLGRIFASSTGWSQVGGTTPGDQYLDWSTGVNTSVWDGSATITQADYTEALANHFRVESGATVTIPTNKWLTVLGNMTVLGSAPNLVVASGGSLIQNTPGVQATVGREVAAWTNDSHGWHLLSSPVAGQPVSPAFTDPTPGNYDFYKWSETSDLWLNQKIPGNNITSFDQGIGYLVAYQTSAIKLFTGPLNVANVSGLNLTKTPGAYPAGDITPGWNLLGNPFSSAITWYNGWTLPLVTTTAKIWKEGSASYTDIAAGGIIPAMQGFMVETSGATSVTIPAAARTHNLQAWYKSTGNPYIRLVAHNPGAQTDQESIVTFDAQSSQGYDPYFDSRFLPGYAPYFYSVDGTEHLSTNVLKELNSHTTVPFDFIKSNGSDYSIEAVTLENFATQVYLTDLKTSHVQILGENPIYNFTAAEGDDPARFLLTFGPMVGTGEKTITNNGIYTYENTLYILNPGKATFELYSLTGQRLQKTEIDSPGLFKTTLFLPTAYYVVRLTTGTKVVVTKVYIKS